MLQRLQKYFCKMKSYYLIQFLLLFIFFNVHCIKAQSINVSGKILASRLPAAEVSVTFIDNEDTTIQYTALTDSKGYYQTNLVVTSVESDINDIPSKFQLEQSYPNPFNSSTAIPYDLHKAADVQITIFDILGRVVRKFNVGMESVGGHSILWDGRNNYGQRVASGIYFYKFLVDGESQVKKMIFNQSGSSAFSFPNSFSKNENTSLSKIQNQQNSLGNSFTIRLRNTNTSTPFIREYEIQNVVIQKDTTINFTVTAVPVATIELDSLHQIIRGFGGSNILLWRPDMTDAEIQTAFGTGDGQLGFSILRIMVEADSNRWSLYLPTAKKVLSMGGIVIGSPWYAPSNMVETVNGVSRVKHDMYGDYLKHLNAFTKFMAKNDVPIFGLSIQNEPDITDQWTSWTSTEIFNFMKNYADSLVGTNVMDPESFHLDRNYSDPILNDSAACTNTDIICGHIYGGGIADYPLAREKGKEVWMTEYLINNQGNGANMDTSLAGAIATAQSISDCMSANMNAYIWWYLVRYYGPIDDGTYLRKGEVTKKGYVMSQFARFVRPGYYRVSSSNSPVFNSSSITVYKDSASSKVIIVAVNSSNSEAEQNFRVQNGILPSTFNVYTTSNNKNCEKGDNITIGENHFKYMLEPNSVTTFVSE